MGYCSRVDSNNFLYKVELIDLSIKLHVLVSIDWTQLPATG